MRLETALRTMSVSLLAVLLLSVHTSTGSYAADKVYEELEECNFLHEWSLMRFLGDNAIVEPVRVVTEADISDFGTILDTSGLDSGPGSLFINSNLDDVRVDSDIVLGGVLVVGRQTDLIVFGDITAEGGVFTLSDLLVESITTSAEISVAGLAGVEGDVTTEGRASFDTIVATGSISCLGLKAEDEIRVDGSIDCSGWLVCGGDVAAGGDIHCGNGNLQATGSVVSDASIVCDGFIFSSRGFLRAAGDVRCRTACVVAIMVEVGGELDVGGDLVVGYFPTVNGDVPGVVGDAKIACRELVSGTVVMGKLAQGE